MLLHWNYRRLGQSYDCGLCWENCSSASAVADGARSSCWVAHTTKTVDLYEHLPPSHPPSTPPWNHPPSPYYSTYIYTHIHTHTHKHTHTLKQSDGTFSHEGNPIVHHWTLSLSFSYSCLLSLLLGMPRTQGSFNHD
jgi:hypothetical protein